LEHFLAVVDEGQFTRAADRCHIAQSALSSSVQALERDLGAVLLHRSTRRVALTDAGRAFVPQARRTVADAAAAREAVEVVTSLRRGTLAMGTVFSAGLWFDLPRLLADFARTYPEIEIRVTAGSAGELVAGVAGFELDVALVGTPGVLPAGVTATPLVRARYIFACSVAHRLAGRRRVTATTVADEVFVDLGPGTVLRQATDQIFAARGLRRSVRYEVHDVDTALALVGHGVGSVILAEPPSAPPPGVAYVPLEASPSHWTLALVTLDLDTGASRPATAMVEMGVAARR